MSESDAVAMLQGLVRALAQPGPRHRHVVVKLDGWALFSLPLIRVAFPDVPWVLMYRDPEEVLISQQRRAGYHMIPGTLSAADVGLAESVDLVATASSLLDHQARILQLLLEVAAAHLDDGPPLLVDYTELPGAVLERVAPWFGIDRDLLEDAGALDAAAFDLKNPHLTYNPDAVAGRRMATDELRAAAGRCAEAHASLVARRGPLTLTEPAPG
jgi:hypothetical protein